MSITPMVQSEIKSRDVRLFRLEKALLAPQITVPAKIPSAKPVAVVGAGPAGLSASNILVQLGYQVTLFDALPVAGGMLAAGIPSFRWPEQLVAYVTGALLRPEIELRLNTCIGRDLSFQEMRARYAACVLAVGAQQSVPAGIPEEQLLHGVIPALSFLKQQAHFPGSVETRVEGNVVVIGGGIATLDAARQAVRAGAESVRISSAAAVADLPALGEEKAAALAEGIMFHPGLLPIRLYGTEDMDVAGVQFQRVRCEDVEHRGEQHFLPVPGTSCHYPADLVIVAVAEQPDLSFLPVLAEQTGHFLKCGEDASLVAFPGVFLAGDVTGGSHTLLQAIVQGYQAAHALHAYLGAHAAPERQYSPTK